MARRRVLCRSWVPVLSVNGPKNGTSATRRLKQFWLQVSRVELDGGTSATRNVSLRNRRLRVMRPFQNSSDSDAEECISGTDGKKVFASPGPPNAETLGRPDGAHIVFSGSDQESADIASSTSSNEWLDAGANQWTSAHGPSMLKLSSAGASSSAFLSAPSDCTYGSTQLGVHDAFPPVAQRVHLEPKISSKKKRRNKAKPKSRERKEFNRLKIALINSCEEDPENFDPETVGLPDEVTVKLQVAKKLRARLTQLRQAALMLLAGGDSSVLLAARAELGFGERDSRGKLIKLKKDSDTVQE